MHALYVAIACIQKIYIVLKDYEECNRKESRGRLYVVLSSFSLFLAISSLIIRSLQAAATRKCRIESLVVYNMGTKIKGICKYISNIFVEKEAELEIGGPTDVKHVAHIGWEGASGTAPTWMREFKTGPEYAATTIGSNGSSLSPWSSQETMVNQKAPGHCMKDINSADPLHIPKPKQKRKKTRPTTTSSPKSGSSSSSRSTTRAPKSKTKFVDDKTKTLTIEVKPINIEVA